MSMSRIAILNEFSIEAIRDALSKLDSFDNLVVNGLNAFQLNEIEKIDPELFAEISEKIKAEKWFPFAGMWCEESGDISDENLARNALYSADYFRKKFGKTFKEYLNEYRIKKAAELLATTNMRVYQVSEAVGYQSLDYFISKFVQIEGHTPSQYRKKYGRE